MNLNIKFKLNIFILLSIFILIQSVNAGTILVDSYDKTNDILYLSWDYDQPVNIYTDTGIELNNYPAYTYLIHDYSVNPISVLWVVDIVNSTSYNAQININPSDYKPEINLYNYFTPEIIIINILMFGCVLIGFLMYYFYLPAWLLSVYLFYYTASNTSDYRLVITSLLISCAIIMTTAWRIKTLGDE